jgi:hypothetical protein
MGVLRMGWHLSSHKLDDNGQRRQRNLTRKAGVASICDHELLPQPIRNRMQCGLALEGRACRGRERLQGWQAGCPTGKTGDAKTAPPSSWVKRYEVLCDRKLAARTQFEGCGRGGRWRNAASEKEELSSLVDSVEGQSEARPTSRLQVTLFFASLWPEAPYPFWGN